MKHFRRLITIIILLLATNVVYAGPNDSIGTKVKNGKIFILHKVEKGQGLYAVARRYNVAIKDIIASNPETKDALDLDQVLLIPTGKDAPFEETAVKKYFNSDVKVEESKSTNQKSTFAVYHKVLKGETLFAIAKQYNTQVDVLKNLNNLTSNDLREGMDLIVPSNGKESANDAVGSQNNNGAKKNDSLTKSSVKNTKDQGRPADNSGNTSATQIKTDTYERKVEKMPEYDMEKIWEKGKVNILNTDLGKRAKVCSHHEAQIGTTIMVTNPANNKAIFVKVVANHALNEQANNIIQLSPAAMDFIALEDGKTVEISFAR